MEHDTAGDPITGLKWTRKTTEKIAFELNRQGILVCANTVGKLLKKLNFSLKVNHKKNEMNPNLDPMDRDQQFKYIAKTREYFMKNNHSVISVDGKKKELIGNFKNTGAIYCREAENVNVYDFPSDAKGKGNPYGIYDLGRNTGFVNVGTDHDTGAFAVASIRGWWRFEGRRLYAKARQILITAGPTREPIDPVRYITNRSSGKMGYAIAEQAKARGGEVVLVSGPTYLKAPSGVDLKLCKRADEMNVLVQDHLESCDVLVMSAAVGDRVNNPHIN